MIRTIKNLCNPLFRRIRKIHPRARACNASTAYYTSDMRASERPPEAGVSCAARVTYIRTRCNFATRNRGCGCVFFFYFQAKVPMYITTFVPRTSVLHWNATRNRTEIIDRKFCVLISSNSFGRLWLSSISRARAHGEDKCVCIATRFRAKTGKDINLSSIFLPC